MKLALVILLFGQVHSTEQSLLAAENAVRSGEFVRAAGIYVSILERQEDISVFDREGAKCIARRCLEKLPARERELAYGDKARRLMSGADTVERIRTVYFAYPHCKAGEEARVILAYHYWDRGAFDVARRLDSNYLWFPCVLRIDRSDKYVLNTLKEDSIVHFEHHEGDRLVWSQMLCDMDDREKLETFVCSGGYVVCIPTRGVIACVDTIERKLAWISRYDWKSWHGYRETRFADFGVVFLLPFDSTQLIVLLPESGHILGRVELAGVLRAAEKCPWRRMLP